MIALLILLIISSTGIERQVDTDLTAIAAQRAIAVQSDWSHNGKPPGVAEVLAYNSGFADPATQAMLQWRGSPSHWAILVDPAYTRIGCAAAPAGEITYFVCILAWPEAIEPLIVPGPPLVPRAEQPRIEPQFLPNTIADASSAPSETVPPARWAVNPLLLAGAFLLGALALLYVVRARRAQGLET